MIHKDEDNPVQVCEYPSTKESIFVLVCCILLLPAFLVLGLILLIQILWLRLKNLHDNFGS